LPESTRIDLWVATFAKSVGGFAGNPRVWRAWLLLVIVAETNTTGPIIEGTGNSAASVSGPTQLAGVGLFFCRDDRRGPCYDVRRKTKVGKVP
jgi:hypothetical protein